MQWLNLVDLCAIASWMKRFFPHGRQVFKTKGWKENWVVVSNIFYVHPYLGKIPILPNIFKGVETTNQMMSFFRNTQIIIFRLHKKHRGDETMIART